MKEPMCNYVIKVSGSSMYHFRRKIPLDLISHYSKKEIKKSLRTSNRREAEKLSRIEATKLDYEWEMLRAGVTKASPAVVPMAEVVVARAEICAYRDEYFLNELSREVAIDRANLPEPDPHNIEGFGVKYMAEFRAERRLAARYGFTQQFRQRIRVLLDEQEMRLDQGIYDLPGSGYQPFHKTEAIRNACKAILSGEGPLAFVNSSTFSQPSLNTKVPSIQEGRKSSLFSLVDMWAQEKQRNLKTLDMYNRTATRFRDLVGAIPVELIKRADVVRFKNELIKIGQSPENANKQLTVIATLLSYARANALINENPATGVKIKIERLQMPRVAYSTEALNAIFNSPVYLDGDRPKGGAGEAAYWIPLLALYTGARVEELGQLHPSDVMEESYFKDDGSEATAWVIRIRNFEEFGQQLKNRGSNRRVPIHTELIRLGFLRYAEEAKRKGDRRLFSQLFSDKYGTETAQFSKWINRYFRKICGITDKRMTFHSFRHTFKHYCRAAGITVHDALTGHVSGRVGDKYGAELYPLGPLVDAINRYKIPGFDLSHLPT